MINELYEKLPVEIVFQILRWSPHKNVEMITDYWNKRNHREKSWGNNGVLRGGERRFLIKKDVQWKYLIWGCHLSTGSS
jgi:hypothetical protein